VVSLEDRSCRRYHRNLDRADLGLVAGYVGGFLDDIIMFITNLFTVIPTFVLLILISFSIGQDKRGAVTIAVVIGFTSWVWTARAVRSQVFRWRNATMSTCSKLSGHSVARIILTDILPYIPFLCGHGLILQILGHPGGGRVSILGLGTQNHRNANPGLMMNWAILYQAEILGKWWRTSLCS